MYVFFEIERPTNFGDSVVDPCERLAIGDFVPDVEDPCLVDGVFHLDDLRAGLFVAAATRLRADFLAHSAKELRRLSGRRIGALGARRELHHQPAIEHHPDSGIHDVKANALRNLKLPVLGPVDLHSGVGKRLLNLLNCQLFLPTTSAKQAFRVEERTTLNTGRANQPRLGATTRPSA